MKRSDRSKNSAPLTAERLRHLLAYDKTTGLFTCRVQRGTKRAGEVAGTVSKSHGYVVIEIDHKPHFGHRLAFLFVTGEWPSKLVDHRNGVRSDNHWENLRDRSRQINQQNFRRAFRNNGSGLLGAHAAHSGKWRSSITLDGEQRHLGTFDSATAAHAAYVSAKRKLHEGCTI